MGEAGTKKRPGDTSQLIGPGEQRAARSQSPGLRWEGARRGRTGTWAGRERSEAWARGEGKAGVTLPVTASPEAPAWTNGPGRWSHPELRRPRPCPPLLSAPLLPGPAACAARRCLPPPAWAPARAARSSRSGRLGPARLRSLRPRRRPSVTSPAGRPTPPLPLPSPPGPTLRLLLPPPTPAWRPGTSQSPNHPVSAPGAQHPGPLGQRGSWASPYCKGLPLLPPSPLCTGLLPSHSCLPSSLDTPLFLESIHSIRFPQMLQSPGNCQKSPITGYPFIPG